MKAKVFSLLLFIVYICYPAYGNVMIDAASFPDETFREYMRQFDTNSDGELSDEEIAVVVSINVSGKGIDSLKGVEYFTSLLQLNCNSNDLKVLDVSKNIALTELRCRDNQLTVLDVRNNLALENLYCYNNPLKELDVSKNPDLTRLYCQNTKLTTLDVSRNTALAVLWCSENPLKTLDVRHNEALTWFDCSYYLND